MQLDGSLTFLGYLFINDSHSFFNQYLGGSLYYVDI